MEKKSILLSPENHILLKEVRLFKLCTSAHRLKQEDDE